MNPAVPHKPLLLASRSPRRAQILRGAGFVFTRFDPPFDDPADPNELFVTADSPHDGAAVARELAERKAASVPADALPAGPDGGFHGVLLTADTLGITPAGQLVGTPQTADQARAMLQGLLGRSHTIATGVALRAGDDEPRSFYDTAQVNLGQISDQDLQSYLDSGQWAGKAGGYNLAERLEAGWPITVEGDPGTVMGLPIERLAPMLIELGVTPNPKADPAESVVS